jgi:hypothetical protein
MKGKCSVHPHEVFEDQTCGQDTLFGGASAVPDRGSPPPGDIRGQPASPAFPVPGSPVIVGAEMLALSQHRPVQI